MLTNGTEGFVVFLLPAESAGLTARGLGATLPPTL